MAGPMPPSTLGMCLAATSVRFPARHPRRRPEIAERRSSVYFRRIWISWPAPSSGAGISVHESMYPCSSRILASSALSLLAGTSTVSCAARIALRTRVRKSDIGSVIDMVVLSRLPGGLRHPGDLAVVRELAQTDTAHPELPVDRARTPAAGA